MIHSFDELNTEFSDIPFIENNYSSKNRLKSLDTFLEHLWYTSKQRAKTKKLEHSITVIDLYKLYKFQNMLCALSGIKLTFGSRGNKRINPYNISIDRIDSSIGYTKDNIQLVCSQINLMKSDMTNIELLNFCKAIVKANV